MKVVRVQFKKTGKRYFFKPGSLAIEDGMSVVVETVRGLEIGRICGGFVDCDDSMADEIKPVVRRATERDIEAKAKNKELEREVMTKCKELVIKNGLEMKLLECEYTLDRSKLIIYFESENRVDFRQLVKDLAEIYHVRIELRQVGSRDGAKVIGGLGPCGLVVCCNTFIEDFDNVSIKMAKNQNLSLNPQKISGTCGKLLCCIKYENETYSYLRRDMPDVNDIVTIEEGDGKVTAINVLKRNVTVKLFEDERFLTVEMDQIKNIKRRKEKKEDNNKELKGLE